MIRKISLAIALAAMSLSAAADMRTVTAAYEVAAGDFRAPGNANGTLGLRECDDCTPKTLRVTSKTRYSVNNAQVSLDDFRRQLQQNRNDDRTLIIVSHNLESETVTAVAMIR